MCTTWEIVSISAVPIIVSGVCHRAQRCGNTGMAKQIEGCWLALSRNFSALSQIFGWICTTCRNLKKLWILLTECIYVVWMSLIISSDYLPTQH